ncbi:hypothetical protein JYB87_02580 [Shewanella avicenniae]|uniref:Uncharacterized protein n=1 Tax=Shewanella avicenniae TaxID=2814294 RepID=A0ABX7QT97_9GAMM|nr:hypothetical protein [Shewanella avicenniae]QSX34151.1 hypothetical protein JYB87_02580 [Shewanella avicenniae]
MKAVKGLMLLAYIAIVVGCYLHFFAPTERTELEKLVVQVSEEHGYSVNYVSVEVCYGIAPLSFCTKMR